ncbi:hypothetical protein B0J17DRAFT_666280 [Rhizoctonia solani]|nr:hypothetical protein B0J17DRAFT_666280 [Rhizoctonia solani]
MLPSILPHRWLLILQFWISTLRLIVALYGSIITSFQINAKRTNEGNGFDAFDPSEKVLLSFQLGEGPRIGLWIILASNDIYVTAFDFKRTNTYSGCLASQIGISTNVIIIAAISLVRRGNEWTPIILLPTSDGGDEPTFKATSYGPRLFLFVFPTALAMLLSFCLLCIATWTGYSYRLYIPLRRVWKYNTKDLLIGTAGLSGVPPVLSVIGSPRVSSESIYAPGDKMRRFFTNLLFRRVIPAETRLYAMTQNIFALVSIAAILFRAVTALRKAHNQTGTRMTAGPCVEDPGIAWEAFTLDWLVVC